MNARGARIGRNMLSSSVGQVLTMGLAVIGTVITARWLGATGRGALAMVTTGASTAALVLSFGAYQALITFVAHREMTLRRGLAISVVLAGIIALLGFAGAALLRDELGAAAPFVLRYLPLGAGIVAFGLGQSALSTGIGRLDLAAANTVTTAAALIVGYTAGWALGLEGLAAVGFACAAWLVAQAIGDAVGWTALGMAGRGGKRSNTPLGGFVRYAVSAYPSAIVGQLTARADILLLGIVSTVAAVGVYSTAVIAASVIFVVPSAVAASLTQPFGEGDEIEAARLARIGAIGAIVSSCIIGPMLAGALVVVAPWLLGPEFAEIGSLVAVLLPGMAIFSAAYPASAFYSTALRRPIVSTYIALVALIIDIALLAVLGPLYGAMGAALASSVGYAVAGVANVIVLWRVSHAGRRVTLAEMRAEAADAVTRLYAIVRRRDFR